MAFDRTERFPKLITQTPAGIGPGTYDAFDSWESLRNLGDVSAFLSTSKRRTLEISKDRAQFPGPDRYCMKESQRHIPGGVSIDYTDARFKEQIYVGLGSVKHDACECQYKRIPTEAESLLDTDRNRPGKLWLVPPPRSIIPSGTSVPSKCDGNGYYVDEYGILVKNPPDEHEPTFLYNLPREERNFTTLKYKGNFWSKMMGRKDEQSPLNPGPGDYQNEKVNTPAQILDEKIRELKRASSRQPRYLETLYRKKLRENFPAPNSYRLISPFDRFTVPSCKCDPYNLEIPPFGRTAKRSADKTQWNTPGPGTYELQNPKDCTGSIYNTPFGACAARLQKLPDNTGPAPGDYHTNVGNLAYESAKRFCKYGKSGSYDYFDKTITPVIEDDSYAASYLNSERCTEKLPVYHAAFKSRTKRFPHNEEKLIAPAPGTYETLDAFKANRDRCDFVCHRLAPPFGSGADRFPKIPQGIDVHVPVATAYNVGGDIAKDAKCGMIFYPRKDEENKERSPGPAHYHEHLAFWSGHIHTASPKVQLCLMILQIDPCFASSVTKKSFNVSLRKLEVTKKLTKT